MKEYPDNLVSVEAENVVNCEDKTVRGVCVHELTVSLQL